MTRRFTVTPTLDDPCVCGYLRGSHSGRSHKGGIRTAISGGPTPVCLKFRLEPAFLFEQAAEEDPKVALAAWDEARPRSSKTARARAAGVFGVGPSDHGSCQKAVEYRENPPADYTPDPVDKSAAIQGTLLHDAMTKARRQRYPWRRFGVLVLIPGLDAPGEVDEFDPETGDVVDYKTAGDWAWERNAEDGPPDYEWKQVLDYALGLDDLGHEIKRVRLIVNKRENGDYETFTRPYDRGSALRSVGELHAMVDALEAGRPLPRSRAGDDLLGPSVNALCAKWCPAVRHCWSLDEVPANRSPEGWLLVRDDEAVAATLVEYLDTRKTATESEKRKAYARVLLEGVEAGVYGDATLAWSGGRLLDPKPDDKARITQLEAEIAAAREEGRVPADLPYPTKQGYSNVTINVKPVRAGAPK